MTKHITFLLFIFHCSLFVAHTQNVGIGNTNPQAALDVQGDVRLRIVTLNLPLGLSNNVDVQTVKSSVYNFQTGTLAGGVQISGLAGGVDGRIITLFNNFTVDALQLYDESSANALSSAAANRIVTASGNTAIIYQNGSVTLRYDGGRQPWTILSSHYADGLSATAPGSGWSLSGNAGTTSANFIGTTDARPIRFGVNGGSAGIVDSANAVTAIGVGAMRRLVVNKNNVAMGSGSLYGAGFWVNPYNTASFIGASQSVAMGDSALFNIGSLEDSPPAGTLGTGEYPMPTIGNTGIGYKALFKNGYGSYNNAVGSQALVKNTLGYKNNAVGFVALSNNTKGVRNTAMGDSALYTNTTGSNNVAIGSQALIQNMTGFSNVAIGTNALHGNTWLSNLVAIGDSALYNNGTGATTTDDGTNNIAVGSKALYKNTTGSYNAATGTASLKNNTTGIGNTAFGAQTLTQNVDGYQNSAFGVGALSGSISGIGNTAIGGSTMVAPTTGNYNTAVGNYALNFGTAGSYNTAIGYFALERGSIGGSNAAFGTYSLYNNTGGEKNTGLGFGANVTTANLTNATAVGAQATVACSNCMVLGSVNTINGASSNVKVAIGTTTPLADLHLKQSNETYPVNGGGIRLERQSNTDHWDIGTDNTSDFDFVLNGTAKAYINHVSGAYTVTSDVRLKKDIAPIGTVMPAIMQLQPKTYRYKDNQSTDPLSYGFIAQEIEQLFPTFVTTKGPDGMKAIAYQYLNVVAIKAIQELQTQLEALQKKNEELLKRIEKLEVK